MEKIYDGRALPLIRPTVVQPETDWFQDPQKKKYKGSYTCIHIIMFSILSIYNLILSKSPLAFSEH